MMAVCGRQGRYSSYIRYSWSIPTIRAPARPAPPRPAAGPPTCTAAPGGWRAAGLTERTRRFPRSSRTHQSSSSSRCVNRSRSFTRYVWGTPAAALKPGHLWRRRGKRASGLRPGRVMPGGRCDGTVARRAGWSDMDVIFLFLFALDFLLLVMLLDAERADEPRQRLERVAARCRALRERSLEPDRAAGVPGAAAVAKDRKSAARKRSGR
jgi:hypothetical protein